MTHRHIPELRWVMPSPSCAHGEMHAKGEATAIARGDELGGVPAEAFGAAGRKNFSVSYGVRSQCEVYLGTISVNISLH